MKRKLTLACIVMLIVETVCLFIPYCFVEEYWKYEDSIVYHGQSRLMRETPVSIFGISTATGKVLAIILLISLLTAALGFIMTYVKKQEKIGKFINFVPLINLVLLAVFAFYAYAFAENDTVYARFEWNINWLFYIIITLQIVTCIFGLLLQFEKEEKVKTIPSKVENINSIESAAEKVRQYEELLDSGVISQEEFETKKKQILGL